MIVQNLRVGVNRHGDHVSMRYLYPDGAVQAVFPMWTVADDGEMLVGYTPAGTQIMYWALPGGGDPRSVPLAERFSRRLSTAERRWQGGGALRVIPRSSAFQVVHFWNDSTFSGWYLNLESAKVDRGDFVDSVDWQLDVWIAADRSPQWKDVDEADAAVRAGYLSPADLDLAWQTGRSILAGIDDWPAPIGDWTGFVAPDDWTPLRLPDGWDVRIGQSAAER